MADLFKKILEERKLKPEHHEDFIATLTSVTYKAGQTLSEDEVIGLVVALLMGNFNLTFLLFIYFFFLYFNNNSFSAYI